LCSASVLLLLTVENAEDGGEEEEQWLAVKTAEASGELRELLSTVLYLCSSSSAPLFTVFINTVCNSAQKTA
jgi:hypothetical protein